MTDGLICCFCFLLPLREGMGVESNSCNWALTSNQDNGLWLRHKSRGPKALVTRESEKNELTGSSITTSTWPDYISPCDMSGMFQVLDLDCEVCGIQSLGEACQKIRNGVSHGTILHWDFPQTDMVSFKEITDVDVSDALTAWSPAILFQENSTLVILKDSWVSHLIPLGFQEIACP